jgi:hypothetical protein
MNWVVPRMWEGQVAAVLASGASMNEDIAEQIRKEVTIRTIAVNNTFKLAPWAEILYAADARWWDVHKEEALKFYGLKVSVSETTYKDVLRLNNSGGSGFDPNPANLRTGSNSGYQALHLAIHTGVRRILLCGFNMHGKHWHPDHDKPLRTTDKEVYGRWAEKFGVLKKEMPKNVEVWNCTPDSALRCFDYVPLDEAIRKCRRNDVCAQFA